MPPHHATTQLPQAFLTALLAALALAALIMPSTVCLSAGRAESTPAAHHSPSAKDAHSSGTGDSDLSSSTGQRHLDCPRFTSSAAAISTRSILEMAIPQAGRLARQSADGNVDYSQSSWPLHGSGRSIGHPVSAAAGSPVLRI